MIMSKKEFGTFLKSLKMGYNITSQACLHSPLLYRIFFVAKETPTTAILKQLTGVINISFIFSRSVTMSSTVLEIKLKRPSKTFTPGDKVSGTVVIRSTTTMKVNAKHFYLPK